MNSRNPLVTLRGSDWRDDPQVRGEAVSALESGLVLYFPNLGFPIEVQEKPFFDDGFLQLGSKNVRPYRLEEDPGSGCLVSISALL